MANMTDSIRIILKAYKEELTVEQIIKILANKKEELKNEILKADLSKATNRQQRSAIGPKISIT